MDFGKRAERERRALRTVRRDIPDLLRASPRAQAGVVGTECIVDPAPVKETAPNAPPRTDLVIRLQPTDALQAAQRLARRPFERSRSRRRRRGEDTLCGAENDDAAAAAAEPRVVVHNMASLARPGGAFTVGGNGQEEFLCARTTLYASLCGPSALYPLPDRGGLYSPDVLVFRDAAGTDLPRRQRFFIDVISAGVGRHAAFASSPAPCTCGVSYCERERADMLARMRGVLRVAQRRAATHLILGDWGCGAALRHPPREVARLWRKCLARGPRQSRANPEQWEGVREVIFAIPNAERAREFRAVFADVLAPDYPPALRSEEDDDDGTAERELAEDAELAGLMAHAGALELRADTAHTSAGRVALRAELARVMQLVARRRAILLARDDSASDADDDEVEDDYVVSGYDGDPAAVSVAASDAEDGGFCRVETTTTSDSDSDAPRSEAYEFRFGGGGSRGSQTSPEVGMDDDDDDDAAFDFRRCSGPLSPKMSPDGWFLGSIDELSAHLFETGQIKGTASISPRSPLVRCASPGLGERRADEEEPDILHHIFTRFG